MCESEKGKYGCIWRSLLRAVRDDLQSGLPELFDEDGNVSVLGVLNAIYLLFMVGFFALGVEHCYKEYQWQSKFRQTSSPSIFQRKKRV